MKKLFAMAVPILPGKTAQFKKFIDELKGKRYDAFAESRKKLGVHERTFFQSTPMGDFVVVTLEGNDPQTAFKNFGKQNDEFTKWFSKEVKEIHGVDLTTAPQQELPRLIVDSMEMVLEG
jgi:hypothetical protein